MRRPINERTLHERIHQAAVKAIGDTVVIDSTEIVEETDDDIVINISYFHTGAVVRAKDVPMTRAMYETYFLPFDLTDSIQRAGERVDITLTDCWVTTDQDLLDVYLDKVDGTLRISPDLPVDVRVLKAESIMFSRDGHAVTFTDPVDPDILDAIASSLRFDEVEPNPVLPEITTAIEMKGIYNESE